MRTLLNAAGALVGLLLAGAAPAAPCDTPEHRRFDFWIGHWEVRTPDGRLAGTNRIEPGYGGCVLHERYTTPGAYRGESLNAWDAPRGVWHQTWVDSTGLLLVLEGQALPGGGMRLEGRTRTAAGATLRHRITWTPQADGSVRQLWESAEGDGDWKVAFDGRYTRIAVN